MREKQQKQMPLIDLPTGHPKEIELEIISNILDDTSTIYDHVLQDLNGDLKVERHRTGANGMSAEQVARAAIVMKLFNFSYEDLAFHISDSKSLRRFCRIGIFDKGFKKSALNQNIKRISPETWELISLDLLIFAKKNNIEKGRKTRVDCTVVESNIHQPYDSMQLYDSVRVLRRLLTQARDDFGIKIVFTDHCHRAKRRMTAIQYAKGEKERSPPYKDLLKVTQKTIGYTIKAEEIIGERCSTNLELLGLLADIKHYGDLARQVYGRYPLKVAFDGGFASKYNLAIAKTKGVKDVCFAKKRGLEETDMCLSHYVYKKLRQFRAGIESGISWLKRSFGLIRCTWKGFRSFKSYVLSSVVAANY
jgi:transposase, IS5 family